MVDAPTLAASVVASVIASVVAALLSTEYRLRREQSVEETNEVQKWYTRAARLGNQIRRTWQGKFEEPRQKGHHYKLGEIQSEMNLLAGQLDRHASRAGDLSVDQEVVDNIDDVASMCREIGSLPVHMNSTPEFAEKGKEILTLINELEESALERL